MKQSRKRSLPFVFLMTALALTFGLGLIAQRGEAAALLAEFELARMEQADLTRLRAENAELQKKQVPPVELDRLRNDRAALLRLRSELAALKQQQRQR